MFFTHTIRRKLLWGLGLVGLMLVMTSVSGVSGLLSYRSVVHDLEFGIDRAPHQAELVHAISQLFQPLLGAKPGDESLSRRQRQLQQRIREVRETVLEFRRRLEAMPLAEVPASQRPVTDSLLSQIEYGETGSLTQMARLNGDLSTPHLFDPALRELFEAVGKMQLRAQTIPDPVAGMSRTLHMARRDYRNHFIWVAVTSLATLVLFYYLAVSAYRGVFIPVTLLHQGARRVVRGDFDYRVQLNTRDEMAELADSFNQMTKRFQEIANNLESQVQDRSRQLVRSERLAGVGFLAAGVAHEINNPLSAISMAAESLEGRLDDLLQHAPPEDAAVIHQYLSLMQKEAERCRGITVRLLDFSRGRDATRERHDVAQIVTEVVAMVQFLSKYRDKQIDFQPPGATFAEIHAPEIKQVVLNLVANGLEAMDAGGTLHIELLEETDHVQLRFRDEGCGMTPDIIESIFEPFFTQKKVGQGTGLGLSISHRIVSEHGGTISAASAGPDQGSTFTVRLPRRAVMVRDHKVRDAA